MLVLRQYGLQWKMLLSSMDLTSSTFLGANGASPRVNGYLVVRSSKPFMCCGENDSGKRNGGNHGAIAMSKIRKRYDGQELLMPKIKEKIVLTEGQFPKELREKHVRGSDL
ncbi:hypothetical protein Tco_1568690 [Tanacetum coccineum]